MTNFIPAASRIAIRKKDGTVCWYDTRKDVEITAEPQLVTCPLRDREVQMIVVEGLEVFFLPEQVRLKLTKDELKAVANTQLVKLEYDIPEANVNQLEDGHPSGWLWNYAVRTTKSCWTLPATNVQPILERLHRLTEIGATWDLVKYDPSETPALIGRCVQALQREVNAAVTRAEESRQRAQTALDATPADEDPARAQKDFLKRAEAIQKRTEELMVDLEAGAKVFGLSVAGLQMGRAIAAVQATRLAMQERARVFVAARDAARAIATAEAQIIADQATAGTMPAEVLADFLQDNDREEGVVLAAALSDAVSPASEDDGTFSLTDMIDDAA